jgi:hypothetical protein
MSGSSTQEEMEYIAELISDDPDTALAILRKHGATELANRYEQYLKMEGSFNEHYGRSTG